MDTPYGLNSLPRITVRQGEPRQTKWPAREKRDYRGKVGPGKTHLGDAEKFRPWIFSDRLAAK
jgi:hypothetical protein